MASESEGFARLFEAWLRHGDPEPGRHSPIQLARPAWASDLGDRQEAIHRRERGGNDTLVCLPHPLRTTRAAVLREHRKDRSRCRVSLGWIMEEPGFTLTDEQRAKVRTAGVLLLNLAGRLLK